MIDSITTKIEIDVMSALELQPAMDLAVQHRMPSIIVHQDLISDAIMMRARKQGKFRLIVPIDWPKGETFGMTKMTGMTKESLGADGFEVLLSNRINQNEIKAEAKAITDFVRRYLNKLIEIRFVLGTSMRDEATITKICEVFKDVPTPNYIRTDTHTKIQQSKAEHETILKHIRATTNIPIKISGNLNSLKILQKHNANLFGVSLKQIEAIIADIKKTAYETAKS